MTINSSAIGANWFLDGLGALQNRELQTQRQLSSGFRVQDAADSPSQTQDLIDLGSSLAAAQTNQSTLNRVHAEAVAGDQSIGSAISLLDSARAIAVQAASSTATATDRLSYSAQIQGIQQQVVSLANTSVEGRFIFGGDADQTPPYQINSASATGVTALTAVPNTRQILSPSGQIVFQGQTAGTIFDHSIAGAPAADNVFAALQNLQTALQTNNPAGIGNALSSLQSASDWLNQQQVSYGAAENTITAAQNDAANQITTMQTRISGIRDTDVAQAATDLAQESTSQSAAFAAQAQIGHKSLFDYLA
jgi:flagellar hook-associated protein 3 FlgL